MKIKVGPSILSADFSCLDREIKKVESAGADLLHIDVMDGHFAPNITIGSVVVQYIRKATKLPLDVHLMIENPQDFTDAFVKAGSDMITLHIETISAVGFRREAWRLRSQGVKVGISLNPNTPISKITNVLKDIDFILVMSVYPGFSGQKFIPAVLPKIRKLRAIFKGDIAVDGGINDKTAQDVIRAGANVLAAGSYIFSSPNPRKAMERIRNAK